MICGAFYPNYFASSDIDETDVMKVMSGHDPFTTVMVCSIVFVDIVAVEALSLVGRKLHLYRANDRRVSSSLKQFSSECQSNPELHWFCFNLLCDWSRKLAPLSRPIRYKMVTRVFPLFRQFGDRFYFGVRQSVKKHSIYYSDLLASSKIIRVVDNQLLHWQVVTWFTYFKTGPLIIVFLGWLFKCLFGCPFL